MVPLSRLLISADFVYVVVDDDDGRVHLIGVIGVIGVHLLGVIGVVSC